jgi:transcriptional regulator with XRE-family HTH domain
VKELAQQRGWGLDELARHSNVKYSTAQRIWQNRTANPRYDTLKAIADALGVSVEELEQSEAPQAPNQTDASIRTPDLVDV